MRVRRRRRFRTIVAGTVGVYLIALALALSPFWLSRSEDPAAHPPERPAETERRLGLSPLNDAPPVPAVLPGSAPTGGGGSTAGSAGESESSEFATTSESSTPVEESGGPAPSPSSSAGGGGSSSGASKTVLGFEG